MDESENISCPFCNDHGFDKTGLKMHLENWCEEYKKVPRGYRHTEIFNAIHVVAGIPEVKP